MKNYIINKNTLAILPMGDSYSTVYELNIIKIIRNRPNNIINYNCEIHGSSLNGRLRGTECLTGYLYKAPINIDDNLVFFPTTSPRLKECSWISLNNLKNIKYDNLEHSTKVNFINNKNIDFKLSKNVLNNQILKANLLDAQIRKNKVENV